MCMRFGFPGRDTYFDWIHLRDSFYTYAKKTNIVIEIGASAKTRTRELTVRCAKIIGVELMRERLPQDFENVKYKLGDWETLTKVIAPNSADLLISNQVLEHVVHDKKVLNETYAVLKKNGIALICTPNRTRFLQNLVDKLSGKERVFPWAEHIREYTKDDLIKLVKQSKFKKYDLRSYVFGIHAGPFYFYLENPPAPLEKWANFLELQLFK